jgi:hypothetical protein
MLISLAKIGSAGDDRSHLWIDPPKSLSHSLEAYASRTSYVKNEGETP